MTPADPACRVRLIEEPCHTFGSADNVRRYQTEVGLTGGGPTLLTVGVLVDETPVMVINIRYRGRGIHAHSSFRLESSAYIAAGTHVIRFTPGGKRPDWILALEGGTCPGVRYDAPHDALISRGDLFIRRFSREGEILWSAPARTVFTGEPRLLPECLEALDLYDEVHRIDFHAGEPVVP